MTLSLYNRALLISTLVGTFAGVLLCYIWYFSGWKYTWSHRHKFWPPRDDIEMNRLSTDDQPKPIDGDFEKYGKLDVPPNTRPTHVAMDIVMRMFVVHGVPAKATIASPGSSVPRLPELIRSSTLTLGFPVVSGPNTQPGHGAIHDIDDSTHELKAELFPSGNWAKVAKQEVSKVAEDEVAADPMSSTFGSGRSMARLYGK
jgi:hypothetical protein